MFCRLTSAPAHVNMVVALLSGSFSIVFHQLDIRPKCFIIFLLARLSWSEDLLFKCLFTSSLFATFFNDFYGSTKNADTYIDKPTPNSIKPGLQVAIHWSGLPLKSIVMKAFPVAALGLWAERKILFYTNKKH